MQLTRVTSGSNRSPSEGAGLTAGRAGGVLTIIMANCRGHRRTGEVTQEQRELRVDGLVVTLRLAICGAPVSVPSASHAHPGPESVADAGGKEASAPLVDHTRWRQPPSKAFRVGRP